MIEAGAAIARTTETMSGGYLRSIASKNGWPGFLD
jgi:hypothetical protein